MVDLLSFSVLYKCSLPTWPVNVLAVWWWSSLELYLISVPLVWVLVYCRVTHTPVINQNAQVWRPWGKELQNLAYSKWVNSFLCCNYSLPSFQTPRITQTKGERMSKFRRVFSFNSLSWWDWLSRWQRDFPLVTTKVSGRMKTISQMMPFLGTWFSKLERGEKHWSYIGMFSPSIFTNHKG